MIKLYKKNLVDEQKYKPIIDESNKQSKCKEISNIFITLGLEEIEFCA